MTSFFQNKTVLITGASRGIGAALAKELAAPGARLILNCSRDTEALHAVILQLQAQEPSCQCYPWIWDLAQAEGLEESLREVTDVAGMPDILVNIAGVARIACLQDMSQEEILRMISVNLTASILLARFCVPNMIKKSHAHERSEGELSPCRILNISSVWGNAGASCEVVYSATKAGLHGFTKALAKELAPSTIPVNALACGAVSTKMNDCLSSEDKAALAEEIPYGRMTSPKEVAQMAVKLLTAPDYCTGQVVAFDGGWI